jgi:hypothetical protein
MEENKRTIKYFYLKISLQETPKIFWKRIALSRTVLSDIYVSMAALSRTVRQIVLLLRRLKRLPVELTLVELTSKEIIGPKKQPLVALQRNKLLIQQQK